MKYINHQEITNIQGGNMIRSLITALFLMATLSLALNAADPTAYVINSLAETMSKINLTTGIVENDLLVLGSDNGSYPNQIVIRDTLAYVVNSGTNEIQIINLNSNETIEFIGTGPNSNPYWMTFYDSQFVYVTLMLENKVARIDLINKTVSTFPTGVSPAGIVILDHKLFVICSGYDFVNWTFNPSTIVVYDTWAHDIITEIDIGVNGQSAAIDADGRIHVACTGDYAAITGEIYIIDGTTLAVVDNFGVGGAPGQLSIGPDNVAYTAAAGFSESGHVFSYNALTGEVYHSAINPIEVDLNCIAAVAYQDSSLFTGSFTDYINVIDSAGNNQASYAVGQGPVHLAFNYKPGDINGDFMVDILDITHFIDYKFKEGPDIPFPRWRANVNADFIYDILDIVHLIDHKFKDGPGPKIGPIWLDKFQKSD
jgi:hypothetical protein